MDFDESKLANSRGMLDHHLFNQVGQCVTVDQAVHIEFKEYIAIGTSSIKGGTIVAIGCPTAAIMAHLATGPDGDQVVADGNARQVMDKIANEYTACRQLGHFSGGKAKSITVCQVICGRTADGLIVPTQVGIVSDFLRNRMEMTPVTYDYTMPLADDGYNPDSGTVTIAHTNKLGIGMPLLYVEDAVVRWADEPKPRKK